MSDIEKLALGDHVFVVGTMALVVIAYALAVARTSDGDALRARAEEARATNGRIERAIKEARRSMLGPSGYRRDAELLESSDEGMKAAREISTMIDGLLSEDTPSVLDTLRALPNSLERVRGSVPGVAAYTELRVQILDALCMPPHPARATALGRSLAATLLGDLQARQSLVIHWLGELSEPMRSAANVSLGATTTVARPGSDWGSLVASIVHGATDIVSRFVPRTTTEPTRTDKIGALLAGVAALLPLPFALGGIIIGLGALTHVVSQAVVDVPGMSLHDIIEQSEYVGLPFDATGGERYATSAPVHVEDYRQTRYAVEALLSLEASKRHQKGDGEPNAYATDVLDMMRIVRGIALWSLIGGCIVVWTGGKRQQRLRRFVGGLLPILLLGMPALLASLLSMSCEGCLWGGGPEAAARATMVCAFLIWGVIYCGCWRWTSTHRGALLLFALTGAAASSGWVSAERSYHMSLRGAAIATWNQYCRGTEDVRYTPTDGSKAPAVMHIPRTCRFEVPEWAP